MSNLAPETAVVPGPPEPPAVPGRFIVLEGWEAAGKSTQAAALASAIGGIVTRQPGDTPVGRHLRALLLESDAELVPRAEALLFAADRAQHAAEILRPEIAAGRHVVCDRYAYSSIAYQGHGRGLDPDEVAQLSWWATEDLVPDLVLLLDLPFETAVGRLGPDRDRIERGDDAFQRRVHEAFRTMAAADERWAVVDADAPPDVVTGRVLSVVGERLGLPGR